MPEPARDALLGSLWVGLGGILGANARYWLGGWIQSRTGMALPWGTLVINLSGSFLLGLLFGMLAARPASPAAHAARLAIGVGFLGAYTTFSTFSAEVLSLLEARAWGGATGYLLGSVLGGILAAYVGLRLGKTI